MTDLPSRHGLTLGLLLALTAAALADPARPATVILILAMAKILLVAFRFMDLRLAHPFWKGAFVLLSGGFLTAIAVLAAK